EDAVRCVGTNGVVILPRLAVWPIHERLRNDRGADWNIDGHRIGAVVLLPRVLIERQTGPLSLGGGYRDPYRPPRNSRPHQIDVFRVRSTRGVPHQGEHRHAARV